jgi:HSP20 family molecular chaperone IbpA
MNNENFNKFNILSHDILNNIHKIGHEVLNSTLETSIPIINTFTDSNIKSNGIDLINYQIKPDSERNKIFIMCEIPGLSKENCKVHYKNNILRVMGKVCYNEPWGFLKNKNYYREIDLGYINKNSIKIKYENGCLMIEIDRIVLDNESNIEIE